MFVFTVVTALLLYNATFQRAIVQLNAVVHTDARVLVTSSDLPRDILAEGAPYTWCNISGVLYPPALKHCVTDYDMFFTINSRYPPTVGTILHEVGHGLGIYDRTDSVYHSLINNNSMIGWVKINGSHVADKASVMYANENRADTLDIETLYILERMGYNVTYGNSATLAAYPCLVIAAIIGNSLIAVTS